MSLSVLRKMCWQQPDRGGYVPAHAFPSVLMNWRFNHTLGSRVSKRIATHMEPFAVGDADGGHAYTYYSLGDSLEARRCLHHLIADNYVSGSPLAFHDVVPTIGRIPYRFYLDLETTDAAMLLSGSLAPGAVASRVIKALSTALGPGVSEHHLECLAFDASRSGSKFSMHLIFPNLVRDRESHAQTQERLLAVLEGGDEVCRGLAGVIDRGSHSSQPRLRMPFCDKITGISTGGAVLCANRVLEYAGEFTSKGAYKDFSDDTVDALLDAQRAMMHKDRDGESSEESSEEENEPMAADMRQLLRSLPSSFWMIPSRLLPRRARMARMVLAKNLPFDTPTHPKSEHVLALLNRGVLMPEMQICGEGGEGCGRGELYKSYDRHCKIAC